MGGVDPAFGRRPVPARLELHPARYDDEVAADLVEQVQEEYVLRYGGRDGISLVVRGGSGWKD